MYVQTDRSTQNLYNALPTSWFTGTQMLHTPYHYITNSKEIDFQTNKHHRYT